MLLGNIGGPQGAKFIAGKIADSSLTEIALPRCDIRDEGVKAISANLPHSKIKNLHLYGNNISDAGVKSLAKYLPHSKVQYLDLDQNLILDEGALALAEIIPHSQITNICLEKNAVSPEVMSQIEKLVAENKERLAQAQPTIAHQDASASASSSYVLTEAERQQLTPELRQVIGQIRRGVKNIEAPNANINDDNANIVAKSFNGSETPVLYLCDPRVMNMLMPEFKKHEAGGYAMLSGAVGSKGITSFAQNFAGNNIKEINILFNKIGAEGAKAIAQHLKGSMIDVIGITASDIGDEGAIAFAEQIQNTQLKKLMLGTSGITNIGAKAIAQKLPNSTIRAFLLAGNKIDDEGAKALAEGLRQSKIETVELFGNAIGDEGALAIAQIIPDSQITKLSLNDNNVSPRMLAHIETLIQTNQKRLAETRATSSQPQPVIDEEALTKSIGAAIRKANSQGYKLTNIDIGVVGARAIANNLPDADIITILEIGRCNIGDDGAKAIAAKLPASNVEALALYHNNIGAEGAKAIGRILPETMISSIIFEGNNIGAEGAEGLAKGFAGSRLQMLTVDNIGAKGAVAFAQNLKGTEIQSLSLAGNNIGDEGAKAIGKALLTCKIGTLNLNANNITDKGASAIAYYLPHSKITDLLLKGNDAIHSLTLAHIAVILEKNKNRLLTEEEFPENVIRLISKEEFEAIKSQMDKKSETVLKVQPQLSTQHMEILKTLAQASPETLTYLLQNGTDKHRAEQQYQMIRNNPHLSEFYLTTSRAINSVVFASQAIHSQLVAGKSNSLPETAVKIAHQAASSIGFGAGIVTATLGYITTAVVDHQRTTKINRITASFPDVNHMARIETIARALTLMQHEEITTLATTEPRTYMQRATAALTWLKASDIDTPIKVMANRQADGIIKGMMNQEHAKAFELNDIAQYASWATNRPISAMHEAIEMINNTAPMRVAASSSRRI